MTRWTWAYESDDDDVSTTVTVTHDEEYRDQVQERFRSFLRGCGYVVDEPDEDYGEASVEELEGRIQTALEYIDTMWGRPKEESRMEYLADLKNIISALQGF